MKKGRIARIYQCLLTTCPWPLILLMHPCRDDWCLISLIHLCRDDWCLISLMRSCRDDWCLVSLIHPCWDDWCLVSLIHPCRDDWCLASLKKARGCLVSLIHPCRDDLVGCRLHALKYVRDDSLHRKTHLHVREQAQFASCSKVYITVIY